MTLRLLSIVTTLCCLPEAEGNAAFYKTITLKQKTKQQANKQKPTKAANTKAELDCI